MKELSFVILSLFLLSCGSSEQEEVSNNESLEVEETGGPCTYEDVEVTGTIIYLQDSLGVAQAHLVPDHENQKDIFKDSYTDDTIVFYYEVMGDVFPGDEFSAVIEVMTEGSCQPYPGGMESEGTYYEFADFEILNNNATDLLPKYKSNLITQ